MHIGYLLSETGVLMRGTMVDSRAWTNLRLLPNMEMIKYKYAFTWFLQFTKMKMLIFSWCVFAKCLIQGVFLTTQFSSSMKYFQIKNQGLIFCIVFCGLHFFSHILVFNLRCIVHSDIRYFKQCSFHECIIVLCWWHFKKHPPQKVANICKTNFTVKKVYKYYTFLSVWVRNFDKNSPPKIGGLQFFFNVQCVYFTS